MQGRDRPLGYMTITTFIRYVLQAVITVVQSYSNNLSFLINKVTLKMCDELYNCFELIKGHYKH